MVEHCRRGCRRHLCLAVPAPGDALRTPPALALLLSRPRWCSAWQTGPLGMRVVDRSNGSPPHEPALLAAAPTRLTPAAGGKWPCSGLSYNWSARLLPSSLFIIRQSASSKQPHRKTLCLVPGTWAPTLPSVSILNRQLGQMQPPPESLAWQRRPPLAPPGRPAC